MADSVNLCSLIEQFGNEAKCREYLEALRWHEGMESGTMVLHRLPLQF
jgi:hypothetical protein